MRAVCTLGLLLFCGAIHAQTTSAADQAQWLLQRLTGVHWPVNSPVLSQMSDKIKSGDTAGAADLAMQQPQFLNVVVKDMALKLSTRSETIRLPLNEFAADFIGITRDGTDARQLLYGNFYYAADPALLPMGVTIRSDVANDIVLSNNHYQDMDKNNVDFGAVLKRFDGQMILQNQTGSGSSTVNTLMPNPDPAGVLTSRTWLEAHAVAGTNRRLVEYTFREFECIPLINWADTQASDIRVGRDVDRYPGGDNTKYETTCKGCHSVQDGFRGAFAKWDWRLDQNGLATYGGGGGQGIAAPNADSNGVMRKLNQNGTVYPGGYVTTDDSWLNFATRGVNATLFGWRGLAPDGSGLSSGGKGTGNFGKLIANSQRFSQCMAQHVFQAVCQHNLSEADAQLTYVSLGLSFEANNYNLKKLFEITALNPKCRM